MQHGDAIARAVLVARGNVAAARRRRKAGKAERDGTKEARQHSPYEE